MVRLTGTTTTIVVVKPVHMQPQSTNVTDNKHDAKHTKYVYRSLPNMANTYTIQSHTNRNRKYTVTFPDTGDPICECVGYGYRGTCSHIKEAQQLVLADLQSTLERQLANSVTAQQKLTFVYFCHTCGQELFMPHTFTGKCLDCTKAEVYAA